MYGKVFLWFFSMFFLVACEDNSKFELLPDAMESKGLTDSITGEEKEVLLNELKELKKEILLLKEPEIDENEKGRIYNPEFLYFESYNARLTVLIADDFFQVYGYGGYPFPELFYKEMWVFRCKSDKDTITYDPQTISEANPPKCRDGKTLDRKKYKQSIEAVRLWILLKENEKDSVTTYSAYDKLAEWFKDVHNNSYYKDVDIVTIRPLLSEKIPLQKDVYNEIYIDKLIKVAKLARDAGFYRFHPTIYENDEFNDYEQLLKEYKIVKSIPKMQYYPTIHLGKPWAVLTREREEEKRKIREMNREILKQIKMDKP